nr:SOS response-associated peptidase family protein [Novosphingobium piscinae]
MRHPADEVAGLFRVAPVTANVPAEVYPGYPGLVVSGGHLRAMTWGFPLALAGGSGRPRKPRPVNNARSDKLLGAFWHDSFRHRRCLIPASAWAEAEGEPGRMTRTWYALPGDRPFALAGLWRDTAEWGAAYSMVMVDAAAQVAESHDRMPLVLSPEDWATWLDGDAAAALALCRTYPGRLEIDRSREPWAARRSGRTPPTAGLGETPRLL